MKTSGMAYVLLLVLAVVISSDEIRAYSDLSDEEYSYEGKRQFSPCVDVCVHHTGDVKECKKACNEK
uniref:Potassium channel toxin n=1 Tax=Hemiscorpius lepturus TaxID=520031 RepID=A0A1L4BJ30_HEMLE|nr:potassium channel toxin [Hemiscorpius lepturus]